MADAPLANRRRSAAHRIIEIADELRLAAADRTRDVFEPDGTRCLMVRPAALNHWADRLQALAYEVQEPEPPAAPGVVDTHSPIHEWFSLSYAHYLTVPRSVLQSMPAEWQERFVACLRELDDTIDWRPQVGRYWVQLRDDRGRFVPDPLADYERGRRRVEVRR